VHSQKRRAPNQRQTVGSLATEDSALVAAVLRKDRKATAEFVARYADDLYRYLRSRLAPSYDQVDDLVHEVFLAAWESLPGYQGTGSLRAWVMGIARHKVEDFYRARLRAPESIEDADQKPVAPASVSDFHQLLEQDELRKNTWRVMGDLPEQYRLALIWRYWEKASAREMALKTGKTEKAIERLLARARAEFRERWNHVQSS
jgi:RNA polymerase sigma-70 factor (ECF subfamily)